MSEILDAALRYLPRTVPLHDRSKRPFGNGWQLKTWTSDEILAHYARHPQANVGVRTGAGIRAGAWLAVIDIDPRTGGADSLAEIEARHGSLPATPTVLTGGDDSGEHRYFLAPPRPLASRTLAPGLELKADGRQVVAPPSLHPDSGRAYRWAGGRFDSRAIAPLPRWLLTPGGEISSTSATARSGEGAADDVLLTIPAAEYLPALSGRQVDSRGYARCPFHKGGQERTPSLYVLGPRPTLWHCFGGCSRGGDIYALAGLLFGIEPPLRGIQWLFVSEQVTGFYERLWGVEPA